MLARYARLQPHHGGGLFEVPLPVPLSRHLDLSLPIGRRRALVVVQFEQDAALRVGGLQHGILLSSRRGCRDGAGPQWEDFTARARLSSNGRSMGELVGLVWRRCSEALAREHVHVENTHTLSRAGFRLRLEHAGRWDAAVEGDTLLASRPSGDQRPDGYRILARDREFAVLRCQCSPNCHCGVEAKVLQRIALLQPFGDFHAVNLTRTWKQDNEGGA